MKLLVVAAFEPELVEFRALVRASNLDVVAEAIGVGVVEAAIGMTQSIADHRPTHALMLGTCGAFVGVSPLAIGEVVTAATTRVADASLLDAHAELPAPMPATCDLALHPTIVRAGARLVDVANTVGITVDDGLARRLGENMRAHGGVEHLEAFAFARACASRGVLGGVVLGIANLVGARGREEWRAHHIEASAAAARVAITAAVALANQP
jgi:futalosine hydrolase